MKPKYLKTHHYKKLEEYSKNKCINIIIEHHNSDNDKINKYRNLYKGYLYSKKLASKLLLKKNSILTYELYNHLKYYKSWKANSADERQAIYDVMNYISNELV